MFRVTRSSPLDRAIAACKASGSRQRSDRRRAAAKSASIAVMGSVGNWSSSSTAARRCLSSKPTSTSARVTGDKAISSHSSAMNCVAALIPLKWSMRMTESTSHLKGVAPTLCECWTDSGVRRHASSYHECCRATRTGVLICRCRDVRGIRARHAAQAHSWVPAGPKLGGRAMFCPHPAG